MTPQKKLYCIQSNFEKEIKATQMIKKRKDDYIILFAQNTHYK